MKSELLINYSLSSSSSSANVLLEQKEWNSNVGYVTKANFIKFIGRSFYGTNTDYNWGESADCGFDGDELPIIMYAYPSPSNLPFTIDASYGILSDGTQDIAVKKEAIKFSLSNEARIKYPVYEMIDISPVGSFYDIHGEIISFDSINITVSGQNIKLSKKVYGTIRFIYTSLRYSYVLTLNKRDEEETYENFYSSVVWAGWNGGLTWKEVELPPGADGFDNDCGWGSSSGDVDVIDGSDRSPKFPKAAGANRRITRDYCSNEIISDSTFSNTDW